MRTMNRHGEDEQIALDGTRGPGKSGLRWSKFHDAACAVATAFHRMVGGGDQINVLENALARAYECGWRDAERLRGVVEK